MSFSSILYSVAFATALIAASSSTSVQSPLFSGLILTAEAAVILSDDKQPPFASSPTPPPGSEAKVIKRMNTVFEKSAILSSPNSEKEEVKGKFDRIITVGSLHGDLKRTLELFKALKVVSHQPDYYKDLMAKWAREDRILLSKGLKPKQRKDSYAEDGVGQALQSNDIAANMLFNKRGELMGGTADEFHWDGGKLLVVILGNALNVGPDDMAIAMLLKRLTREAAEAKGKLVYVLGTHEINNLQGNFIGVHPWSFEGSGGEAGRRRMLSTQTRLGRFLRSRPGIFYYDHLMFMHGGLLPSTVQHIQKTVGMQNMTGQQVAEVVNSHLKLQLFKYEGAPDRMDLDPIAATVSNVDYATNGEKGVLLIDPVNKCPLVEEANHMTLLQAQIVSRARGFAGQPLEYRFCDGGLFGIDFLMSQWASGKGTSMGAALELTRVPLPSSVIISTAAAPSSPGGSTSTVSSSSVVSGYRWYPRLLLPRKDPLLLEALSEPHRISRFGFGVLVLLSVIVVESLIILTRYVIRRRKLAHAASSLK